MVDIGLGENKTPGPESLLYGVFEEFLDIRLEVAALV